MEIVTVVNLWGITTIIYYTRGKCYQCCCIGCDRIYSPLSIFYSADAAEEFARLFVERSIFSGES